MPKLIIVRGLPGSGKSTKAKELIESGKADIHLEADMFFYDKKGNYIYDRSLLKEAHQWCQTVTKRNLVEGKSVVVSNTFVKMWEMKPYIEMCKELGIDYEIIKCEYNGSNIHSVPQEVIKRMKDSWEN